MANLLKKALMEKRAKNVHEKLKARSNTFRGLAKLFKAQATSTPPFSRYEELMAMSVVCEGLAEVCENLSLRKGEAEEVATQEQDSHRAPLKTKPKQI